MRALASIASTTRRAESAMYFYHDAIGITRRNEGFENSEIGSQVFPIGSLTTPTHHYILVGAESRYFLRTTDNISSIDQSYALKKAVNDGLHSNKGWSWAGDVGDGEPAKILGSGGYYNEKKPYVEVRTVTTANITLSGEQTINSVACVAGDRVGVKNQTDQTENGIYVVALGAWSRATDADSASDFQDMIIWHTEPTTHMLRKFYFQTTQNPTVGVDNIVFALYEWNCAQNFLGSVLPKDGGGYIGIYAANGPGTPSGYSIGLVEGADIENMVRVSHLPLLTGSLGGIHPRMVRQGATLHIFIHNFFILGTEGRIARVMHYTSPWNDDWTQWSLTLVKADMFNGTGVIEDPEPLKILGNIGDAWFENNKWYFLSTITPKSGYPANQGKVTAAAVAGVIKKYSTEDFTTFVDEGVMFTDSQLGGIGVVVLAGQITHGGEKLWPIIHYKWQGKATTSVESEPYTNVKLLTTAAPEDGETVHANGEVWPIALISGGLLRTDQPQEATLSPIDVLPKTALDIVGSPTRTWYASMQAASGAYIKRSGNIITNPNKFAFKCRYSSTVNDNDTYTIVWFGRASDGEEIFRLENTSTRFRVTVRDGAGLYKQYRFLPAMTGLADIDGSPFNDLFTTLGFMWDNGTLTGLAQYQDTLTIEVVSKDDVFTDLGMIGDELRLGAGPSPSTDFNQYPNAAAMWLNGADATFENWRDIDVI